MLGTILGLEVEQCTREPRFLLLRNLEPSGKTEAGENKNREEDIFYW